MTSAEILEFARLLVERVRDEAIRSCDQQTKSSVMSPVARRWRRAGAAEQAGAVIPDCVDETVFQLLRAIDDGTLQIRFVAGDGRVVDLGVDGGGELAGWYMGSGGWRGQYSEERFVDDFVDLAGKPS